MAINSFPINTRTVSLDQILAAEGYADAAEAARDAAQVDAKVYASTAAGLAVVAEGEQFMVVVGDEIIRYEDVGGVATERARYPTSEWVADLRPNGIYSDESLPDGYAFGILDGGNRVAFGIKDDGTTETTRLEAREIETSGTLVGQDWAQGWGQSVTDSVGRVGAAVSSSGRFAARDPVFKGTGRRALKSGLRFPGDLIYINNTGQSNAEGTTIASGNTALTTSRERGAFGMHATRGLMELTGANFNVSARGENPTYGTIGFILELLEKEDGLDWERHDVAFIGSNNGLSGNTLAQLSNGGGSNRFENAISQAGLVKSIAENAGLVPSFAATTWAQGEAEVSSTTYKANLIGLAQSYRTLGKAATGQDHDPLFVTWQLCVSTAGADRVSRAQLEAANENPGLIWCSGPTYHLPRLDGTHFTNVGYKWLGAMFGLVYKRVVIDGKDWSPLQPTHHTVVGSAVDLHFNKRGLVFDTAGDLPAQTNMGFTATEADNTTPVTVSSVAIVGPDRVRVTLASTPQPGWRIKYGHSAMTGITAWTYTGPGGNLRDNAGDLLTYDAISKPMHNWCCIFNFEV
jgi:hypothetical protein